MCGSRDAFFALRGSRGTSPVRSPRSGTPGSRRPAAKGGARVGTKGHNELRGRLARLPARVRLAVARVPADLLAKGHNHAIAGDRLPLAQAMRDGHAHLAVPLALDTALADGHDARAHLLTHVHLERGALERRRWRGGPHGVVKVRRLDARRWRRRLKDKISGTEFGSYLVWV